MNDPARFLRPGSGLIALSWQTKLHPLGVGPKSGSQVQGPAICSRPKKESTNPELRSSRKTGVEKRSSHSPTTVGLCDVHVDDVSLPRSLVLGQRGNAEEQHRNSPNTLVTVLRKPRTNRPRSARLGEEPSSLFFETLRKLRRFDASVVGNERQPHPAHKFEVTIPSFTDFHRGILIQMPIAGGEVTRA
jgi:hypothetical protein